MDNRGIIYICSPLSASTREGIAKNMKKAKGYADKVNRMTGLRTIAPHSFLPKYFDDNIPEERTLCLDIGLHILKNCAAVVVCGEHISDGMKNEILKAKEYGISVFALSKNHDCDKLVELKWRMAEHEMQIC